MPRLNVDDANDLVNHLIGLLCSVGTLVEKGRPKPQVLALIGHGLGAAGNPVPEWEREGPVPDDHAYLPLFSHFEDGQPIPWDRHVTHKEDM